MANKKQKSKTQSSTTTKPHKRRGGLFNARSIVLYASAFAAVGAAFILVTRAAGDTTPVYGLYNNSIGDHVYTTSTIERDQLLSIGWGGGGTAFYACLSSTQGAIPVYRLYHGGVYDHYYTASTAGRDSAISNGFTNEGIGFYACPSSRSDARAVYGTYNASKTDHLYTTSSGNLDYLASAGYANEGIAFYGSNGNPSTPSQPPTQPPSPVSPPPTPPGTSNPPTAPPTSPASPPANNSAQNPISRPTGNTAPQPNVSNPAIQGSGASVTRPITIPQAGPDTVPPSTPADFKAIANQLGTGVGLTWQPATDNTGGVTYWLEKSTNQQDWQVIAEDRIDTFFSDTEVKFETRYYYRLRARDGAGNYSGQATADAITGNFNGNASPDTEAVVTDEQKGIEVVIPAGALFERSACTIEEAGLYVTNFVTKDQTVVGGPFQVLCKKADNTLIAGFDKPLSIKWTIQPPKNVDAELEYYGYDTEPFKLATSSRDAKANTGTFTLERGITFIALGNIKRVSVWVKLAAVLIGLVAVAGAVLGYLSLRYRKQLQSRYDDYRRKTQGG